MADMHRPGRIGRDIFDIDRLAAADIARAVLRAQLHRAAQRLDPGGRLEREIDEAWAGDVDLGDESVGAKLFRDRFGKLARFLAGILGQHHGGVGRDVAMRRIARRLDGHARLIDACRQDTGSNKRRSRGGRDRECSAKMFFVAMVQSAVGTRAARLTQFRGRVKEPRVLGERKAVGHAGDEIGDAAGARRALRGRQAPRSIPPAGRRDGRYSAQTGRAPRPRPGP